MSGASTFGANWESEVGKYMVKSFLVGSEDESFIHWEAAVVAAACKEEAIERYLQVVYCKDEVFRESVLALTLNCSFIERFVTPEEGEEFMRTGDSKLNMEDIFQRTREYFCRRPDLGDKYVSYMKTRNEALIDEEMYEFIAMSDPSGICALDLDEIRHI